MKKQPESEHLYVPVTLPRQLFYCAAYPDYLAVDAESDMHAQFGNWVHLAMWRALKHLMPATRGYTEPHAAIQAITDAHKEWMQKHLDATESELAGIGDVVEFVVPLPTHYVGTAWTDDDCEAVGRLAIATIDFSWHILDEVYDKGTLHSKTTWMMEAYRAKQNK